MEKSLLLKQLDSTERMAILRNPFDIYLILQQFYCLSYLIFRKSILRMDQHPNDELHVLKELPAGMKINSIALNCEGRRLAIACSNRTVKFYTKINEQWREDVEIIRIDGESASKIEWAHSEFGDLISVLTETTKKFAYYQLKLLNRSGTQKYEWEEVVSKKEDAVVEDMKIFCSASAGVSVSYLTKKKGLYIHNRFHEGVHNNNPIIPSEQIQRFLEYGLNCHSWSRDWQGNNFIITIGGNSNESNEVELLKGMKMSSNDEPKFFPPCFTLTFVYLRWNSQKFEGYYDKVKSHPIKEYDTVHDLSWGPAHGKSYHLLAVATCTSTKVYEVVMKQEQNDGPLRGVQIVRWYSLLEKPSYSLSWNYIGNMLAVGEKRKILLLQNKKRGSWEKIKELVSKE